MFCLFVAGYAPVDNDKANDILTIDIDGTNLTQLTAYDTYNLLPSWGKDGRIHFVSERDKYKNIWSVIPEFIE